MFRRWIILYIIFKYCLCQFIIKSLPKNATFMQPRIVGGRPASLGDVPYQVAFKLRLSKQSSRYATFCGGVIIRPTKILTAAHCFVEKEKKKTSDCCHCGPVKYIEKNAFHSVFAVAGNLKDVARYPKRKETKSRKLRSLLPQKNRRKPWQRLSKPRRHLYDPCNSNDTKSEYGTEWNNTKWDFPTEWDIQKNQRRKLNIPIMRPTQSSSAGQWRSLESGVYLRSYKFPHSDIAVITITKAFKYNKYVKPIPIASRYKDYKMTCLASGYGMIDKKTDATHLLLADLEIVPTALCSLWFKMNAIRFVCTRSVPSDIAKGDSGGPLVCKGTGDRNDKGDGVLVGIVCGNAEPLGSVMTRVSAYRRFIKKNKALRNENSIVFVFLTIYNAFCLF